MSCFHKIAELTPMQVGHSKMGSNSVLALIPARSGSKRLPNKNILEFNGKPLIQWTVEAALDSGIFTEVVVSTDCPKIAEIARRAGANVPYLRSAELASDSAKSVDVMLDVLQHFKRNGRSFDVMILLQVTSPLRQAYDIKNALDIYKDKEADFVFSVSRCTKSPLWTGMICEDGSLHDFIKPEHVAVRSQDLPQFYEINGAIYICSTDRLMKTGIFEYGRRTFPYIMESTRSVDIDDQLDFDIAQYIHSKHLD